MREGDRARGSMDSDRDEDRFVPWVRQWLVPFGRPGHTHLILAGAGKEEALGEDMKRNTLGARHREVTQLGQTVEPNQAAGGERGWTGATGRGREVGNDLREVALVGQSSIGHTSEGARTAHRRPTEWRCRVGALGRSDCRSGRAGEKAGQR